MLGHEIGLVVAHHRGERLGQQVGVQTVIQLAAGMASSNPATVQLVAAAVELWKWMQEASNGQRPSEWRSTHPSEAARIEQLERWMPEAMTDDKPAR